LNLRQKIGQVPRDSDPRMSLLAKSSCNCKQTCPLVREGVAHDQARKCLTVTKTLIGPQMGLGIKTDLDFDSDLKPVSLETAVSECSSSVVRACIAFFRIL
jgi:hypothetical protein